MGKINLGRVILGGIAAGILIDLLEGILNGVLLQKQWIAVMTGLGKSSTMSVKQIVAFNLWGLAAGILMVWLYAGIRARFGAGPKTAMLAGLAVWFLADGLGLAGPVFLHIYQVGLAVEAVAYELVEMLVAGLVGAYLYREEAASLPKRESAASAGY
jgi:hypothetical protein